MNSTTNQIPWPRILIEGVVIVGSILLAFGIDEAWDQRQERVEERQILLSLQEDFEVTRDNFLMTIRETERVSDTITELLAVISGAEAEPSSENFRRLLRGAFFYHHFEPRISTYQDIVNSGRLRLIRSDDLRTEMALLAEDLGDADAMVDQLVLRRISIEEPYLIERANIAELYRDYERADIPPVPFEADSDAFQNRDFANIMAGRIVFIQDIIVNGDDVLWDLEVVLSLIEDELNQ